MVFTLYSFLVRSNTWSVTVIAYNNTPYLFLIDSHSYIDSLFITIFRLYQFLHLPHVGLAPFLSYCWSVPNFALFLYLIQPHFPLDLNTTTVFHFSLILGILSFFSITILVWTEIWSLSIYATVMGLYSFLILTRLRAISIFVQSRENWVLSIIISVVLILTDIESN